MLVYFCENIQNLIPAKVSILSPVFSIITLLLQNTPLSQHYYTEFLHIWWQRWDIPTILESVETLVTNFMTTRAGTFYKKRNGRATT